VRGLVIIDNLKYFLFSDALRVIIMICISIGAFTVVLQDVR